MLRLKRPPERFILIGSLLQKLNIISKGLSGIGFKEDIEREEAEKQGFIAVKGEGRDEFAPSRIQFDVYPIKII